VCCVHIQKESVLKFNFIIYILKQNVTHGTLTLTPWAGCNRSADLTLARPDLIYDLGLSQK
jgi:hypothetical protein